MKFIETRALHEWLDRLAQEITLIAPTAVGPEEKAPGSRNPAAQGQQVFYRAVSDSSQIAWDFTRTVISAREHFMPKTETLFTIETGPDGETALHETKLARPRVIFGIRPCDARGLRVLDAVMLEQEPADVYYAERRRNTTLVGLSCPQMWEDCFCTSVGGAPNASDDVDILLTQVEVEIKYEGYMARERTKIEEMKKVEGVRIPERLDFSKIGTISTESRERLTRHRPATLGQAARIPGIRAADITALIVELSRARQKENAEKTEG